MPSSEMRQQRVWNPAVEGKDGEGREEGEGHGEKSLLSPTSVVGPFLFAQLRNQFLLHQSRPLLPPPFPAFPFSPPFPLPPSLAVVNRPPPVAAIPPPFLMVAAMMAAAPRAFHVGTFGTTPTPMAQQFAPFNGPFHSLPPLAIGNQLHKQCQEEEDATLATPMANGKTTKSAQNVNQINRDKRVAKKRKREKMVKNERNGEERGEKQREEEEEEKQNAKKGKDNATDNAKNSNPIVQMVMNTTVESTASTTINFNTCAICGDKFRLTSDLVQHARTNHRTSRYDRNGPRASIAEEAQKEREWSGQRKKDGQTHGGTN